MGFGVFALEWFGDPACVSRALFANSLSLSQPQRGWKLQQVVRSGPPRDDNGAGRIYTLRLERFVDDICGCKADTMLFESQAQGLSSARRWFRQRRLAMAALRHVYRQLFSFKVPYSLRHAHLLKNEIQGGLHFMFILRVPRGMHLGGLGTVGDRFKGFEMS